MKTSNLYFAAKKKNDPAFSRKSIRESFRDKKVELIAWMIFFGVGVAYFVTTLILAL